MGFDMGGMFAGMSLAHNLRVEDEARQRSHDQQDFQAKMSNTAHTREVADLRAAGLNPILSAGGSGASTPSGASMMPNESDPSSALAAGLRIENETKAVDAAAERDKSQTDTNSAQAEKTAAEAQQTKWLNEFYKTPEGRKALIYRDQKNMVGGLGAVGSTIIDPVTNSAKAAGKAVKEFINTPGKSFQIDKSANDSFKRSHPLRR